jgi:hypothetical protein
MNGKRDTETLLPDVGGRQARRRALEGELSRPARGPRRPARIGAAALALLVLGTGVAWAAGAFSANDISFKAGVGCYSEARLHGPRLSVSIFHAAADPVAKCEKYWREGVIDTTLRRLGREGKIDYPRGPYPPHLVACAKPGSPIFVFPGGAGVCERLEHEPLPDDYAPNGRKAARAYTAWNEILASRIQVKPGQCTRPGPIGAQAERLLSRHGYGDIAVRISDSGPCAKSVESRGRAIEVQTTTPQEDGLEQIAERSFKALHGLFARASLYCISPERFGVLARGVLMRAGLGRVEVGVSQRMFPCTYGSGGFSPERVRVDIGASDRKTWRLNRAGFLRYHRQLRRRHKDA